MESIWTAPRRRSTARSVAAVASGAAPVVDAPATAAMAGAAAAAASAVVPGPSPFGEGPLPGPSAGVGGTVEGTPRRAALVNPCAASARRCACSMVSVSGITAQPYRIGVTGRAAGPQCRWSRRASGAGSGAVQQPGHRATGALDSRDGPGDGQLLVAGS